MNTTPTSQTTDKPFDVAKLQDNIRQFGELLGEVIREQEGEAFTPLSKNCGVATSACARAMTLKPATS